MASLKDLAQKVKNYIDQSSNKFDDRLFRFGQKAVNTAGSFARNLGNEFKAQQQFKYQSGPQNVVNAFKTNPQQFNIFSNAPKQIRNTNLSPLVKDIASAPYEFTQNRIIQPAIDVPKNIRIAFDKNKSPLDRVGSGMMAVGGLIPGIDDIAFGAYDYTKGAIASKNRGGTVSENIRAGLKGFTGKEYTGAGDVLAPKNEGAKNLLNLAELPALLFTGGVKGKEALKAKNVLEETDNILKAAVYAKNSDFISKDMTQWMKNFDEVKATAQRVMPQMVKNKEMKKLETKDPSQWLKVVSTFMEDQLMKAKNPEINFGFSTQPIRRLEDARLPDGKQTGKNIKIKGGQDILQEAKKQIGSVSETKVPLRQKWEKFYQEWVNKTQPIEDLSKKVAGKVSQEADPYLSVKRFLGAGGVAELRHQKKLKPILDSVSDIEPSDFDVFLKSKRDIELAQRGIKGSDAQKAQAVINSISQKYDIKKLDQAAGQLYNYQLEHLTALKEAGFINKQTFNKITSQNKFYVPFERVTDELDNFLGLPSSRLQQSSQVVKKIEGSDKAILSPVESIIANTYKTEAAVAKNRVAKSIADLRKLGGEFAEMVVPSKDSKGAITVWENGQKKHYKVPELVEESIKGLNEENATQIMEILSMPARILRQQATGRNIDFMIPNIVRDQIEATFNSKYAYRPFIDYFDGMRHWLKFKFGGGDDIVEQWINSGGSMFFENMAGRKNIQKQIADAGSKKSALKQLGEWVIGGIDVIGDLSEKPTRIGLFKRGLAKGATPFEAAANSREATLDFARMGAKMKTANSLVPFLNVGVQGFDRMVRTVKNNPKAAVFGLATYAGLPALMTTMYNNLYHGEDYAQVPDFEKEGNFIIMTDARDEEGNAKYIKVPKAHWVQFAANPIENIVTAGFGNNPQTFSQVALTMLSGTLPIIQEGSTPTEILTRTAGGNLPQALKVPVEQMANFDFFKGQNIVPWYMQDKPAAEQSFKSTPTAYKKAGELLNISPLRLRQGLEGSAPAMFKTPVNILETMVSKSQGKEADINKIPVARRFLGSYAGFDTERPESKETKPLGIRIKGLVPNAQAAENFTIPKEQEAFTNLYKEAYKKGSFSEKKSAIEYDPTLTLQEKQEKIAKLTQEAGTWATLYNKMTDSNPEMVFEAQIETYKSGSGASVEDRAKWVYEALNKSSDKELQEKINKMWESKVLTAGASGTAQFLKDEYGIDVFKYTGKKNIKISSGGKKPAKITISAPKFSSPSGGYLRKSTTPSLGSIKISKPQAIRVGKTRRRVKLNIDNKALKG